MSVQPTVSSNIAVDLAAIGLTSATIVGWIPAAAAFASLIWFTIQIWESRTIQHWINNRREVHKARKVARLRAKEKVIIAQLEAMESVRQAKADARDKVASAMVEAEKLKLHEDNQTTVDTQ